MKKLIIFIILSAFLFSTMEVALKLAGASFDTLQLTFLRFLIGGLILLPIAASERKSMKKTAKAPMPKKYWAFLPLLGFINVPVCMSMFQFGVSHSNASTVAVIFCCNPIFTMVFAHFMTKDDKLNKVKVASLALGFIGIIMMIRPWDIQAGNTVIGIAATIGAALIWGIYSVIGGKSVGHLGPFTQTAGSFLCGSAMVFVEVLILNKPILTGVLENLPVLLYASIAATGLGYLFYFYAIKLSDASTGSIVFFFKPVIAPIVAVIVLHEAITYNMFVGIALILAASYLLIFVNRKNTSEELPLQMD
ncbi:MAG: DMT family transporter [Clostridiales Family XIII bacterium]|jgi:drug/metabolite transporter (DMT)-like permease|nr:DMT family transporter [Clostridiales Family XIII bacterium]